MNLRDYMRLAVSIVFLCGTITLAQQNWDPPTVTVFPDHNLAARSTIERQKMLKDGRLLFEARFNLKDGAGRPTATGDSKPTFRLGENNPGFIRTSGPDANSCSACHNQPSVGGAGDFAVNVFVGAQFKDPPTTSITTEITSERNSIGMFGSGAIEMLAREMTRDLLSQRSDGIDRARALNRHLDIELVTKGVSFGIITTHPDGTYDTTRLEGIDPDLVVKPFGVKGIATSLREFTINAANHHIGMQAVERFGWLQTGVKDFDSDGVEDELTVGQVSALVLFQASLPAPPYPLMLHSDTKRGRHLFSSIGCAECHIPALRLESLNFLEPNPYNRPGNVNPTDVPTIRMPLPVEPGSGVTRASDGSLLVWAFTDLKRHVICDSTDPFFCNELLRQDNVPTNQFLTSKLWDLATSSPYGHRGDCTTVSEVILHHAAEGKRARDNFLALDDADKRALIGFLLSLGKSRGNNGTS